LLAAPAAVVASALAGLNVGAAEGETENRDARPCPGDQLTSHFCLSLLAKENPGPAGQSSCEEQTSRH
jgi:hypothetical protein